jgi:hypothetical protein
LDKTPKGQEIKAKIEKNGITNLCTTNDQQSEETTYRKYLPHIPDKEWLFRISKEFKELFGGWYQWEERRYKEKV